ncbi:MAG: ATPase, partial [Bacteroidota bacterium]
ETFYMPDPGDAWNEADMIKAVSYVARRIDFQRIVALDDFDVEKAAALREHLRVPGMGDTRTRYFRDKLAMRERAQDCGIAVPAFSPVVNHGNLHRFMQETEGPWVLKPRSQASAMGIKKINHPDELWPLLEQLGDEQSFHVLERFLPGDIYHVDCAIFDSEVVLSRVHKYGDPPMKTMHEGGVFTSFNVETGSPDEVALQAENLKVVQAMGQRRGVMHTEFIKAHADGTFYFLETAARVGGANIAEMMEASCGLNLWREWAKIECTPDDGSYAPDETYEGYSGILVSLARQEWPDLSGYSDPEIVWKMNKRHHAGLIVKGDSFDHVQQRLDAYSRRFYDDFYTRLDAPDKATY